MDNNRQYMNIDDAWNACVIIQRAWRKSHCIEYKEPIPYEPITDIEIKLLVNYLYILIFYVWFSFGCFLLGNIPQSNIQLQIDH